MAITKDSSRKKQPKGSCFFGCFGFSSENLSKKKSSFDDNKRSKWFSWSRKKRSTTKTVPVNSSSTTATAAEKAAKPRRSLSKEVHMLKLSSTRQPPVNHAEISPVTVGGDQGVQNVDETKYDDAQTIIIEKSKSLDTLAGRKSTARRTLSNLEGANTQIPTKDPPQAGTLTPPKRKKPASGGGGDPLKSNDTAAAANFDSVVGMSIIMITLIIMLVWGKLCAILCTSAWFYFVPRFTARSGSEFTVNFGEKQGKFDPDSDDCKKKVVLEGLLARNNHRSGVRIGLNN